MPDSDSTYQYMDIVEILEARIHAAETKAAKALAEGGDAGDIPYGPGRKIPTHQELAEEFGVHYSTISKAIAILKDRALVVSNPPRGVYVAK